MSKLYLLTQTVNNGYDTHDSCVVCAENEEEARRISPSQFDMWHDNAWYFKYADGRIEEEPSGGDTWALPKDITVKYLGEADEVIKKGVICASFNAG